MEMISYIVWSPLYLRMGYKIGGSTGHSSVVMLPSQISSTWCIENIRKYGIFRKTSLCNPDGIFLEKKRAYTSRKGSLQLFSNMSDNRDSSFPVAAETLEALGGTCLGRAHVQLCNFVFPCKIELRTIVPIFGNTLIPCLTLE